MLCKSHKDLPTISQEIEKVREKSSNPMLLPAESFEWGRYYPPLPIS